jgi:hypothetical protein
MVVVTAGWAGSIEPPGKSLAAGHPGFISIFLVRRVSRRTGLCGRPIAILARLTCTTPTIRHPSQMSISATLGDGVARRLLDGPPMPTKPRYYSSSILGFGQREQRHDRRGHVPLRAKTTALAYARKATLPRRSQHGVQYIDNLNQIVSKKTTIRPSHWNEIGDWLFHVRHHGFRGGR